MNIDYDKFWNELVQEIIYLPQQPDEITVREFADRTGLSQVGAYRILERLVKEGKLTKRSKRGECSYYRPVR